MTNPSAMPELLRTLEAARKRIEVDIEEIDEARRRRDLLAAALLREFGQGSHGYINGSVAHGDALTPLTDVDVGVVVPNADGEFGPGANGPAKLQHRAANAIRDSLKDEFPDLRVIVEGRKRSVLVVFGAPVDPGQRDLTADVIVAVAHPSGRGLWIPNSDSWDRSDPINHTKLVYRANQSSRVNYSRTVRLLKHWARMHSKPLCSWNIKALGLASLTGQMNQLDGMLRWFDHAIGDLAQQETPDPAGVAAPIRVPGGRLALVERLIGARAQLAEAHNFAAAGYQVLAIEALAVFFNDEVMLPRPAATAVAAERLKRSADLRPAPTARTSAASVAAAAPQVRQHTPVRSWAP